MTSVNFQFDLNVVPAKAGVTGMIINVLKVSQLVNTLS
jgi:hypothetical protein